MLNTILQRLGFGKQPTKPKTVAEIRANVERYKNVPLEDFEREQGITTTNSLRPRSGYSKNKYYHDVSDLEREKLHKRTEKFLDAS